MNEDDSARREFVFGLFLTTIVTPLLAGVTAFAAVIGALAVHEAAGRLRAARRGKPPRPSAPHMATPRALRHTNHRHTRRALSTRRPGGVLH
ncbi:hypothetical protein ACQP1O_11840 [Nocardia sp. CA-151230]|uniref:hypothetical protein n=1 Tax=Nocardia sp. CA-151230 TaxID=3239982 RepID=UPI003D8BA118